MNAVNHSDTPATSEVQSDVSAGILQNAKTLQYLMGLDIRDLKEKTLIHMATSSNNPKLLDTLITYCGLPLNAIANRQWEQLYAEGTIRLVTTPLSLVLSNPLINNM